MLIQKATFLEITKQTNHSAQGGEDHDKNKIQWVDCKLSLNYQNNFEYSHESFEKILLWITVPYCFPDLFWIATSFQLLIAYVSLKRIINI